MNARALLALVLALVSLVFAGCATVGADGGPGIVQRTLDATLPADFTGSAEVGHKNAWVDVEIVAHGLRRTVSGWTWRELRYRRNGRVSHGWITLTPEPEPSGR